MRLMRKITSRTVPRLKIELFGLKAEAIGQLSVVSIFLLVLVGFLLTAWLVDRRKASFDLPTLSSFTGRLLSCRILAQNPPGPPLTTRAAHSGLRV